MSSVQTALASVLRAEYPSGLSADDISASLRRFISSGKIKLGEPLPTIRALAEALAVAPATIMRAYQNLAQEGFIRAPRFTRDRYVVMVESRHIDTARAQVLRAMIRRFKEDVQSHGFTTAELAAAWEKECGKR